MKTEFDHTMQSIKKSNPRVSVTKTPWAIHCRTHGQVFLTHDEYGRQMRDMNSLWKCPICGHNSQWDDDNYDLFVETDEQTAEDTHRAELEAEAEYAEQQKAEEQSRWEQEQEAEGRARYEQESQEYFDQGYDGSGEC